jgi:colanic acid biosynthesis glycosyl transferase WcaI
MRIQIITNLFAPDELAGAALFTDLALFLRDRGHDVRVTTTFSYYPAWKVRSEDRSLEQRDELFQGIPVRRVRMFIPSKPTGMTRLLCDFSFLLSLIRRAKFADWRPDVILTALPMLSQCLAQRFLFYGQTVPRFIVVQDFVVEAALDLGILRLPGLGGCMQGLQRWALRSAEALATISPLMLEKLTNIVGADRRTRYIPNWIHASLQMEFTRQQNHPKNRIANRLFYAGNLGVKQGLPEFIEQFRTSHAASQGWELNIHGGGADRERLHAVITQVPGCRLGPVLTESEYVSSLMTSTACLVTQRGGSFANYLPSKLLPALVTGTPVLAVCSRHSPLGQEVNEGGFGTVVEPGDAASLQAALREWQTDVSALKKASQRAFHRAQMYQRDRVLSEYEAELLLLAHGYGHR